MPTIEVGFCKFSIPNYFFALPGLPSFQLPTLDLFIEIDLSCPLNDDEE